MNKKIGLVLEGGGHRGIYTAGLLDVFLENIKYITPTIQYFFGTERSIKYLKKL